MKILKIKEKYEEKTGIPKEDCILKNWEGKIMQNEKTIGDYVDKMPEHHVLSDETKSAWLLLHYIHSTWLYPGMISRNMVEDLKDMYEGAD